MIKNKIFYLACFGFVTGVLWRSFLPFDFLPGFLTVASSVFLIFFLISKRNLGIFVSVFALAFSVGILRFSLADNPPTGGAPEFFEKQIGQIISLTGMIIERPEKKENNAEIIAEIDAGGAKTKILIFADKNGVYKYGDQMRLTGKLLKPENFLTDQQKEFDYVNYLKKDGIFFIIRNPKIEIISRGGGNFVKRTLFAAREKFTEKLNATIPAPESLLMNGLILGERASFSESLRQNFINTGLIHIVTVSGYNVTIVADWIMKIMGFLPAAFATTAGIFAIFLYVIMTGGAQTAIRAGIMATLALLAKTTEQNYNAGRALVLAGAIMIFINPFILAFDVSFQLSFLATIAVIFLTPKIEKYFLWIKQKEFRDIASLTVAAYIFVLPFILYKMGNLSVVALPANFAVLPFIPITMISGFITAFTGLISNTLAVIPGKFAYFLLHYELGAINFFSQFSFVSLSVPNFPLWLTVLIYAIFFYYLFAPPIKLNSIFLIAPIILTFIAAGFLSYRHYESNEIAKLKMQALLINAPAEEPMPIPPFIPDQRTKSSGCELRGPLPDRECTPGAVFKDATIDKICVRGYTKTVRNVSTKLRKEVYAEYGIPYPQPRGAYEVDHLVPLAIGGSNDIANLFTEPAKPAPGFHEKDIVEVYLQQEVCGGRVALSTAQRQIADDWLAIYNNLTPEEISAIKKKYGGN